MIAQYVKLSMIPSGVMPTLYVSQYDVGRPLGLIVTNGTELVNMDSYSVTIEATRSDGTQITTAVTTADNIGTFQTTATMTNVAGIYKAQLVIAIASGKRIASIPFLMNVTAAAMDENGQGIAEDQSLYQQYTGTVQTLIATIRADLNTEIANRQSAVSAEAAARQTADNTLQSNINSEASTRAAADQNLQAQISQIVAPSGEAPSAAEVQNARVGADGVTYPTLGDAIRANDSQLKSQLEASIKWSLLNGADTLINGGYYGSTGNLVENASWYYSETYVCVKPNTQYCMAYYDSVFKRAYGIIALYDSAKNFITRVTESGSGITTTSNTVYARISIRDTTDHIVFKEGTDLPTEYVPFGYDIKTVFEEANENNLKDAYINASALIASIGAQYTTEDVTVVEHTNSYFNKYNIQSNPTTLWKYYTAVIEPNTLYLYNGAASGTNNHAVQCNNAQGKTVRYSDVGNGIFITPYDGTTLTINTQDTITLKKITAITPHGGSNTDVLEGKKLYCGGDSIIEAVRVGTFDDTGYKKSFCGFVAERNGMTFVSDGIGGSCMGNVMVDGWNYNAFCVSRYLNIPTDADYIALWFGWNDSAYGWQSMREAYCLTTYEKTYSNLTDEEKAAVDAYRTYQQWLSDYAGTKDSTDDKTWGGAWNKVLTWLLNNCYHSHIGILIPGGTATVLCDVLIAVCEKYGVQCLKAYDSNEFFSFGHSINIGTTQAEKRKELYTFDGTHPNELGYEFMSYPFEQFLKRI